MSKLVWEYGDSGATAYLDSEYAGFMIRRGSDSWGLYCYGRRVEAFPSQVAAETVAQCIENHRCKGQQNEVT